ncbi:MAG: DUF4177 domain-containing protein [bacterium]
MAYEYKMVQIPQDVTVKMKEQRGNEAAAYLESIANSKTAEGWEFYRVDEVGVMARPGCLGSLFGRQAEYTLYYVITFRRSK